MIDIDNNKFVSFGDINTLETGLHLLEMVYLERM